MRRLTVLLILGSLVSAIGLYLNIRAGALATHWHTLGFGAWEGTTDTSLRQSYREIGLICLWLGASLLAATAWSWTMLSDELSDRSESARYLYPRQPRRH